MLVTKSFSKLEAAIVTEGNLGPEAWAILVISLIVCELWHLWDNWKSEHGLDI